MKPKFKTKTGAINFIRLYNSLNCESNDKIIETTDSRIVYESGSAINLKS